MMANSISLVLSVHFTFVLLLQLLLFQLFFHIIIILIIIFFFKIYATRIVNCYTYEFYSYWCNIRIDVFVLLIFILFFIIAESKCICTRNFGNVKRNRWCHIIGINNQSKKLCRQSRLLLCASICILFSICDTYT